LPSALLAGGVVSLRDFPITLLTFCSVSSAVAPESLRVFSFALLLSARRNSTHIALAPTVRSMPHVLELMMAGSEACSRHVDAWANEDKQWHGSSTPEEALVLDNEDMFDFVVWM